jgi:tyrosyl-tRNA synthetase
MALPISVLAANVAVGFAKSNGEAKRAIQGGGIRVNDQKVSDEKLMLTIDTCNVDGVIKLSKGSKTHVLIRKA